MRAKNAPDAFYQEIKANEEEHVKDLKDASKQYLEPYYPEILAMRGTDQDLHTCEANLRAQFKGLSTARMESFLDRQRQDVGRHDQPDTRGVPGRHQYISTPQPHGHCDRVEIIVEPKPAPPAHRTR
jgi:hypothetical protein